MDDTLIMCEDSLYNVITIKAILRGYELASGFNINFHKSNLASINMESKTLACYAKTLNCNLMRVPFMYLVLEIGGNPRKRHLWEPILEKLKAKLFAWNERFLSLVGRICLIKLVFTALPLFFLSFFKVSKSHCKSILVYKGGFYGVGGMRTNLYCG